MLKKNKERFILPYFKNYYKPIVIKTVWYRDKDRNIDQCDRIQSPEMHTTDFWQGCQDHSVGEVIVFSTYGAGITG